MKTKRRSGGEFNASSMADIAFLLLIFFLMVTTIDTDKGIMRKLPPWPDPTQPPPESHIKKRDIFEIRVNARDQLLVEGEYTTIGELNEKTKEFILNNGKNPKLSISPDKAVVSIKNDRGTSYNIYLQVQNELTAAYNEIRENEAMSKHGMSLEDLPKSVQKEINSKYPMKISEAEPENIGGK